MKFRMLALGLVAVTALGTACGDGAAKTKTATPLDVLTLASSKTADAGTARIAMTMSVDAGGQKIDITGAGLMDMKANSGQMSMNLAQLGGAIDMVFQPGFIYMKLPAGLPGSNPKKPWIKLDLEALGKKAGVNFSQLSQLSNQDPTKALDYLKGVSGEITVVGKDDVRGESTTHYKTTLDLDKAALAVPAAKEAMEAAKKALGDKPFPVDVWIDGAGRMRKMVYAVDLAAAGQSGSMTLTMEMYDFGTAVSITPPPADQVDTNSKLFG